MNVSYELTADDLVAFTMYHNATSTAARRQRSGCLIPILLVMLALPVLILATSDKPIGETAKAIWPLLAVPTLFAVLIFPFLRWQTARLTQKLLREGNNTGFYGPCTLSLDDDGIRESKDTGDTMRKWSAVKKFAGTRDHLFIYTSGVEAFVIPTRAFGTSEERIQFEQLINERAGTSLEEH